MLFSVEKKQNLRYDMENFLKNFNFLVLLISIPNTIGYYRFNSKFQFDQSIDQINQIEF